MTTKIHAVSPDEPDENEPIDPFDVDRLRSASLESIGVEKVTLTIPVRRPAATSSSVSIPAVT